MNKELDITDKDITGKYIVIKESTMSEGYKDIKYRIFLAESGFGTKPYSMGKAVFGTYVIDGERSRIERYDIERFATNEEVENINKDN